MALDEDLEILMRLSDPLRAQMIKDVLEQDGIVVATPGLQHQALLGRGVIDIVLRVPRSDLRRAQELVAAFDSAPIVGEGDDDDHVVGDEAALAGPGVIEMPSGNEDDELPRHADPPATSYRASARGAPLPPVPKLHRSKQIAAYAGVALPFGGAHLYARSYPTAALFAAIMIATLVAIGRGVFLAVLLPFVVVALDVLGATWHCDRSTRGVEPGRHRWRRFAAEIALVVVAGWYLASTAVAGAVIGERGRRTCRAIADCGDDYDVCVAEEAQLELTGRPLPAACARCLQESACEEQRHCATLCY